MSLPKKEYMPSLPKEEALAHLKEYQGNPPPIRTFRKAMASLANVVREYQIYKFS